MGISENGNKKKPRVSTPGSKFADSPAAANQAFTIQTIGRLNSLITELYRLESTA
jgi:hypothetical protein